MAQNLKACELPLNRILSTEYNFFIPSYQRPYSWTVNEAGTLFDDLYDFWKNHAATDTYFLGSIVLVKQDNDPSSEVIDGQQRLTTLTILLAALSGMFDDAPEAKHTLKSCLWEQGNIFLGIEPKPRLKLRDRDAAFFENYILNQKFDALTGLNSKTLSDSQRMIQNNALLMRRSISDRFASPQDVLAFVSFILKDCYLVVVSTPNTQSAFRVFSVLNNRGLSLMPCDIIKANIIGKTDRNLQQKYTDKWDDMEESLGRDGFNSMLSHIRMIFAKCKSQSSLVESFESFVISRYPDAKKLVDEILEPYSSAYNIAVNAAFESFQNAESINSDLRWLNKIDDSDWLPATMVALKKYDNDEQFLKRFTEKMERLAAALYLTSKTLNYRIERYAEILKALEGNDKGKVIQSMELTPEEKNALINVLNGDVYHLPARKRTYAITRLDSFVSDNAYRQIDSAVLTIEHVLPQSPAAASEWIQLWPDADQRERWTHKIANLVPLTRKKNSQVQNFEFTVKKENYFKGKYGTSSYALTTQVLECDSWTPEYVFERQRELLRVFSEKWELDYMCQSEDYSDIAEQESAGGGATELVDHRALKWNAVQRIEKSYNLKLKRDSDSHYVSDNFAVHICSAGYNTRNKEYWYSITPDNLDWLSLSTSSYMAFAMGTTGVIIMFSLEEIRSMLPFCLTTLAKDGKSVHHYHLSFVIREKNKVYFKQKKPERMLIDVTSSLIDS